MLKVTSRSNAFTILRHFEVSNVNDFLNQGLEIVKNRTEKSLFRIFFPYKNYIIYLKMMPQMKKFPIADIIEEEIVKLEQ